MATPGLGISFKAEIIGQVNNPDVFTDFIFLQETFGFAVAKTKEKHIDILIPCACKYKIGVPNKIIVH